MAAGDTLCRLRAAAAAVTLTTDAAFEVANNQPLLAFDAAADETARFQDILPQNYFGVTGVTVILHCGMVSATTGNVVMTAEWENQDGFDLDGDSFAAAQSVTQAVPGTAGQEFTVTIPFTDGAQMDSAGAGDMFRLRVTRDADNGSDTATGDLRLYMIEIRET